MVTKSNIEWTQFTWNPATGCTKISPGCKHCYAETMAERLQVIGAPGYENGFKLTLHPERIGQAKHCVAFSSRRLCPPTTIPK